ncbi:MAG: hypothetical protein QW279_13235, partial [Candidatus Jordarchaeaceae archaeon]
MRATKQKEKENMAIAMGYGVQGKAAKDAKPIYMEEIGIKTELNNARIRVSFKKQQESDDDKAALRKKYNIERYDLHPGYIFPEEVRSLIPSGTPE